MTGSWAGDYCCGCLYQYLFDYYFDKCVKRIGYNTELPRHYLYVLYFLCIFLEKSVSLLNSRSIYKIMDEIYEAMHHDDIWVGLQYARIRLTNVYWNDKLEAWNVEWFNDNIQNIEKKVNILRGWGMFMFNH